MKSSVFSSQLSVLVGVASLILPAANAQVQIQRAQSNTSYLGIMMQEVTGDRARELRLPEEEGVEITVVEPNSPAASAGLMAGDVVVQYNGQRVEGIEQLSRMVRETPAGREIRLQIYRNGAPQTITAKIGSHPAQFSFQLPNQPNYPNAPQLPQLPQPLPNLRGFGGSGALGVEAEGVSGQLAEYFGVRDSGVLVRSVMKNSPAEKAGIKAGDVITSINNAHVASPMEITSRVRAARGQSVPVVLMRDHREMTLNVQLDADGSQRF